MPLRNRVTPFGDLIVHPARSGNGPVATVPVATAKDIDACLHRERVEPRTRRKITFRAAAGTLPDGTMVVAGTEGAPALLLYGGAAHPWTTVASAIIIPVTNPIESVFATVRHRTVRTKGCLPQETAKLMMFKLITAAAKTWRRLNGENLLPKVIRGITFRDGVEVTNAASQDAACPRHPISRIAPYFSVIAGDTTVEPPPDCSTLGRKGAQFYYATLHAQQRCAVVYISKLLPETHCRNSSSDRSPAAADSTISAASRSLTSRYRPFTPRIMPSATNPARLLPSTKGGIAQNADTYRRRQIENVVESSMTASGCSACSTSASLMRAHATASDFRSNVRERVF